MEKNIRIDSNGRFSNTFGGSTSRLRYESSEKSKKDYSSSIRFSIAVSLSVVACAVLAIVLFVVI